MIIGHLGVALGAQRYWPKAPAGWLLVATMAPDIWRLMLSANGVAWWPSNTLSHALPWSGILAIVLASFAWLLFRQSSVAFVVLLLVATHVGLDMISGWKPLWIGGPSGLNLQRIEPVEFVLESALAWTGWLLLPRSSAPRWLATKTMLFFMLAVQAVYLTSRYNESPEATRCLSSPFYPCWKDL